MDNKRPRIKVPFETVDVIIEFISIKLVNIIALIKSKIHLEIYFDNTYDVRKFQSMFDFELEIKLSFNFRLSYSSSKKNYI